MNHHEIHEPQLYDHQQFVELNIFGRFCEFSKQILNT